MSRWKIALSIVGAIVIVAVLWVVFGTHSQAPGERQASAASAGGGRQRTSGQKSKQPPVPVTVVPVKQTNLPIYLSANGTVQAHRQVTVVPQVGGQLLKLEFTEGDTVKKGQVLARIDPRTYQANYDQAVAQTRQDKARLATARSTLKRDKGLIGKSYISKQDLESQANTVRQLEATVEADEANAKSAKVQLDYTKVRAPISGLTGIRRVDPGNVLAANSEAIVTLAQIHPIDVIFNLPEQNLPAVRAAQQKDPLAVHAVDPSDSHTISKRGKLRVINNEINSNTGTFEVRAQFPNKQNKLFPGQFVNIKLHVATAHKALVVPSEAIQRGPDGNFVYLLKSDETVKQQPVTVNNADNRGDTALIENGLKAGEKVVTEGQFRLNPGTHVQPLAPGEQPKAPTQEAAKHHGHR